MTDTTATRLHVEQIDPTARWTRSLLTALDAELDAGAYTPDQQFGYDVDQLVASGVRLFGVFSCNDLVGLGGIEIAGTDAELKRCYVMPEHRGSGAADTIMTALLAEARAEAVTIVRLETGVHQHAALNFYRRHGFEPIPRFGPYVDSETSICMARDVA